MSFGFSIGDFITVGVLAYNVSFRSVCIDDELAANQIPLSSMTAVEAPPSSSTTSLGKSYRCTLY